MLSVTILLLNKTSRQYQYVDIRMFNGGYVFLHRFVAYIETNFDSMKVKSLRANISQLLLHSFKRESND